MKFDHILNPHIVLQSLPFGLRLKMRLENEIRYYLDDMNRISVYDSANLSYFDRICRMMVQIS
jgi:hypothetical protein